MKNKVFEGVVVEKVQDNDSEYGRIAGNWGLKDIRTQRWMPRCFSRDEYNIQIMSATVKDVLSSPPEELLYLLSCDWEWFDDNYVPARFAQIWFSLNPDAKELWKQHMERKAALRAKKLAEPKKKRGRPRKNPEAEVLSAPGKRGRKAKGGISMKSPKKITLGSGKRRGRPPKALATKSAPKTTRSMKKAMPKITLASASEPKKRGRPRKNP